MCDAILTDDFELASIALESCLADINTTVEGGEYGAPYVLGTYGFFSDNLYDEQAKVLQNNERLVNEGREFLSELEWGVVDRGLRHIATHGKSKLTKAIPGDTIIMLACRNRAIKVACFLAQKDECALLDANVLNDSLKDVVREYNIFVTDNLLRINSEIQALTKGIIVPSVADNYIKIVDRFIEEQADLRTLMNILVVKLQKKLEFIETRKWEKKKLELRKQVLFY